MSQVRRGVWQRHSSMILVVVAFGGLLIGLVLLWRDPHYSSLVWTVATLAVLASLLVQVMASTTLRRLPPPISALPWAHEVRLHRRKPPGSYFSSMNSAPSPKPSQSRDAAVECASERIGWTGAFDRGDGRGCVRISAARRRRDPPGGDRRCRDPQCAQSASVKAYASSGWTPALGWLLKGPTTYRPWLHARSTFQFQERRRHEAKPRRWVAAAA